MSRAHSRARDDGATGGEDHAATALDASGWLGLAAAPTFAAMALWAGVPGGGRPDMLCSITQDAGPLSGTVVMYLLMAAFHSPPWLRLMARRPRGARAMKS